MESFRGNSSHEFPSSESSGFPEWNESAATEPTNRETTSELTPGLRLTMNLRNIPLKQVIRYVCRAADLQYKIGDYAVIIAERGTDLDRMELRTYGVEAGAVPGAELPRYSMRFTERDREDNDNEDDDGSIFGRGN